MEPTELEADLFFQRIQQSKHEHDNRTDPNKTLEELRALVEVASETGGDYQKQIIERFQALDEWILHGGFLPTDWAGTTIPSEG